MRNAVGAIPLGVVDEDVRVSVVQRDQIADVLVGRDHAGEVALGVLLAVLELVGDLGEKLLGNGLGHGCSPIVMRLDGDRLARLRARWQSSR